MIEAYLHSFNLLSEAEIKAFEACIRPETLAKGDFLIRAGEVCRSVAFVKTGLLRSFFTKDDGTEITYCITFPDTLITAYSAFITNKPTEENIQALSNTELLVIQKADLDRLTATGGNWTLLLKHLAEQQYLELEQRLFMFQKEKAVKRYALLLKNQPDYILQIPLQYLASYLGITPRHLSRLRKEILL